MEFDLKEIITVGMMLFAVIDTAGSITIIVDLRAKHSHIESERTTLVAGLIMIFFLFVGEEFLNVIGIDVHSFAVAGSFVLFFLALEMILGIHIYRNEESGSASIVPPGLPLDCRSRNDDHLTLFTLPISLYKHCNCHPLNIILVHIVLKSSSRIEKMLEKNGLGVIRKAFGAVLSAIAVKLFAANVKDLFL